MKLTRLVTVAVLAGVFGLSLSAESSVKRYIMFNGSNTDSTEQASPWIPIRGASRVVIKMYSTHLAFGSNADSTFGDSLQSFSVLFSDSVCCVGDTYGQRLNGAADSIMFTYTGTYNGNGTTFTGTSISQISAQAFGDTTRMGVSVWPNPVSRQLRAPSNGTGIATVVAPLAPIVTASAGVAGWGGDWMFAKDYMRVRVIPIRRMTAGTAGATGCAGACGNRVNGLKGFRMFADVYRDDTQQANR